MKNVICPECQRKVRSHIFTPAKNNREKIQEHYRRKGDWKSGKCPGSGTVVGK